MKRTLSVILAIVMLFGALPLTAYAAQTNTADTGAAMTVSVTYDPDSCTGTVTWSSVTGAVEYHIWVMNYSEKHDTFIQVDKVLTQSATDGCSMTIDSKYFLCYGWGSSEYKVDIKAANRYGEYIASGESNVITTDLEILDTPVATFGTNGIVSWNKVPNADHYFCKVYRSDGGFHLSFKWDGDSFDISERLTVGNKYLAEVCAVNRDSFRDSDYDRTPLVTYQGNTVISNFTVTGITAPVAGKTPNTDCTLPQNCGYKAVVYDGKVTWYTEDGDILGPSDKFVAGAKYSAQVTLMALDGYEFAESGLTGTMNGKDTSKSIFIAKPKKTIYMSRWFTCDAEEPGFTVKAQLTSFLDKDDLLSAVLKKWEGGTLVADTTKYTYGSNSASFTFSGLKAGKYRLTVKKKNHVTRDVDFTVSGNTTQNVKICPIGDADNNGKVNSADAKAVFQHGNEQKLITDEYKLQCADVASPKNRINSADAKAIFQHANEQKSLWVD